MKRQYGYHAYRGRSAARSALKAVIAVLAALLVLGLAAAFFLQQYTVYSADGARVRLPWSDPDPAPVAETPSPSPSEPLVVITPEPEVQTPIHAVTLPESALTDGTALQQVEAAGGNAALFDMKTDEGALAFTSAQPLAVETGVNAPEDRNAAIQALNAQEGLYTVARVSCFRDNTVPRTHPELALRSAIGNWRDDGYRWFSPAYPEVRSYVTGVCLELAGLGFDEILLDWACYPVSGDLSTILTGEAYDPATLSQTLTEFYTQLRADLEAAYPGVKLSAVLPADLEQESAGGQTPALAELLDRVWVWTDAQARPALATLLSQHGLEDPDSQLVLLGAAGQGDQSWALWPAG
ncbi:MAG TPA: putative glycoside hydrolase [Candidatus Intestinimonas pullistercoris]|uniref:Glycoside hydrolase n=1 Tax=Candidatus Intestinimonas pullistercoris TaxID=2838623 RepID=A0A9D2T0U4_9FIRM|nr:putative glycoside hydrolase [uncultured Intestinimonas sp.]HJC41414.1 putative glycoside hydrolase [Candidatus Intestinimonas pullistercoris]